MFSLSAAGKPLLGFLYSWGSNNSGQLGLGDTTNRPFVTRIGSDNLSWKQLSIPVRSSDGANPFFNVLAIRSDGALFAWGRNSVGQLGLGDTTDRSSPVQVGSSSWSMVASGGGANGGHTLGITVDGKLFSWGGNNLGQLGHNDLTNRSSPVQVGSSSWAFVATGSSNSFAIRVDGALFSWGVNTNGVLGLNDVTTRSSPVQIGTSSWSMVSVGIGSNGAAAGAITTDGKLFTWGRNFHGALGLGDSTDRSSPVQVGSSSWSMIASGGGTHMAGITTDKRLFVWGVAIVSDIDFSAVGIAGSKSSPVQVGTRSWKWVGAGSGATNNWGTVFAIDLEDNLYTWGTTTIVGGIPNNGSPGCFGLGPMWQTKIPILVANYNDKSSPVQLGTSSWSVIASNGNGWETVACVAAIDSLGRLFTWGRNRTGILGLGDTVDRSSPTQVGSSSWVAVAVGCRHMLGITSDGRLFSWGSDYVNAPNRAGALGHNDAVDRSSPTQIGTSSWSAIGAGYGYSYAIRVDGALFSWGSNLAGQLGLGDTTDRSSPVQIGSSSWSFVTTGAMGGTNNFGSGIAIRSDGLLFTWGSNGSGQLGLGDITNRSSPTQVGSSSWVRAVAGEVQVLAIRSDGALFAWGNGGAGQLGLGATTFSSSPVQVGTSSWTAIGATVQSSAGITSDGKLFTWGGNRFGQLGHGTSMEVGQVSSPVQVGTDTNWAKVTMVGGDGQFAAVLATKTTGALFTWGGAAFGCLGRPVYNEIFKWSWAGTSTLINTAQMMGGGLRKR